MIMLKISVFSAAVIFVFMKQKHFINSFQFENNKVKKIFKRKSHHETHESFSDVLEIKINCLEDLKTFEKRARKKQTIRCSAHVWKEVFFDVSTSKTRSQFDLKLDEYNEVDGSSKTKSFKFFKSRRHRRSSSSREHRRVLRNDISFQNQRIDDLLLDRSDLIPLRHLDENERERQEFLLRQIFPNYKTRLGKEDEIRSEMNKDDYSAVKDFCISQKANKSKEHDNITHPDKNDGSTSTCTKENKTNFPVFWTIVYSLLVLCLFIGLATVCDDFFVPSLELISEKLSLSKDVAGATFMAAGSSAPELFASVAGMGTGSDVGVGAIVGSALFNLLVIIALTSTLTGRVLQLDWKAVTRDAFFYSLSLVLFILFAEDAVFAWWESLCLLLLYAAYIVAMRFNPQIMTTMNNLTRCCCSASNSGRVSPDREADNEGTNETPKSHDVFAVQSPSDESKSSTVESLKVLPTPTATYNFITSLSKDKKGCSSSCPCCCKPEHALPSTSKQNSGNQDIIKSNITNAPESSLQRKSNDRDSLCDSCSSYQTQAGFQEDSQCNKTRNQFMFTTPEQSNTTLTAKCEKNETHLGVEPPSYDQATCSGKNKFYPTNSILGKRCRCGKMLLYFQSSCENVMTARCICCCCACANSHHMNRSDIARQNGVIETTVFYDELSGDFDDVKAGNTTNQQEARSNVIMPSNIEKLDDHYLASSTNQHLDSVRDIETLLVFPCLPRIRLKKPESPGSSQCGSSSKYIFDWIIFALSLPWVCIFTWTVPDCSQEKNKKWFYLTFLLSVGWIAGLSYWMVELVEKIGCLLNIDNYTMGLIVVAVGTSVPDAISSILVAKAGYGDMAVSNAIGSNVFDINLGLGLPFLVNSIITGKPVRLLSPVQECLLENLSLSTRMVSHVKFGLILLLILLLCMAVLCLVRFKLNKVVGYLFIILYIAFIVYAFIQEKSCHTFYC